MGFVFVRRHVILFAVIIVLQVQNCSLHSNWKSQKRSAEPSASEALKPRQTQQTTPTHQLHRRLLPKTEMQQKNNNVITQNFRNKSKNADLEDVDGNEVNRLPEINNSFDDLHFNEDWKQGECTNCGDDNVQTMNKWTIPLLKSGDKRYYIGTFFKANWYRAAQFCRYHGMQLASVSNQEENDKLEKFVTELGHGFEHFWTSGTDLAEEGSFFWMSTGRPISFTNWNAGEPNNFKYENGEEEHCLELWNRDGKGLKWNDSPCSFETYFVCEV